MNILNRYADFVYRVATGDKRLRMMVTFPVAILFFSLVALFVLASFWVDSRWTFFSFQTSQWTLVLAVILLLIGFPIYSWPALVFLVNKGTPVPFNPPQKLIISGPYRYIRNPMLLGLFISLIGLGVFLGSFSLLFIFTPVFVLINVFYLKTIEEKEMEKKFGAEYRVYKARVPMFIPWIKAFRK